MAVLLYFQFPPKKFYCVVKTTPDIELRFFNMRISSIRRFPSRLPPNNFIAEHSHCDPSRFLIRVSDRRWFRLFRDFFYRWRRGAPNPGLHSETNPHSVNPCCRWTLPPHDSFSTAYAQKCSRWGHTNGIAFFQSFPFPSLFIHGVKSLFFRSTAKNMYLQNLHPGQKIHIL